MGDLRSFVRESNRIEGILRAPLKREIEAHEHFLASNDTLADLEDFVAAIQPGAVLRREDWLNVRVGSHIAPRGGPEIVTATCSILARIGGPYDPYIVHHEYETLHPFTDGNGRSGRIIWLKMMGVGALRLGFLHLWYYQSLQGSRP